MKTLMTAAIGFLAASSTWAAGGVAVPVHVDFFPLSKDVAVETTWARLGNEWRLLSLRNFVGAVHDDGFDAARALRNIEGTPVFVKGDSGSLQAELESFHTTLTAVAAVHLGLEASMDAAESGYGLEGITTALFDRTMSVDWGVLDRKLVGAYAALCLEMKLDQAILRFAGSEGADSTPFALGLGLRMGATRGSSPMPQRVAAAMGVASQQLAFTVSGSGKLRFAGPTGSPCSPCGGLPFPWGIPCSTCCYAGCPLPVPFGGTLIL